MDLINGDCLEKLKELPDKSVDFVFLDLPYGQTACKWDVKIDLDALWKQLKRIARNDRTPFFFSTTTKFGFELIKANEKWFRWDLVWKKNRAAGFLNAYKLPMRKHEMIYCFAKKSPEYDVSSHKEGGVVKDNRSFQTLKSHCYGDGEFGGRLLVGKDGKGGIIHNDPLPTSDITPPTTEHELVYCFAKKSPDYDVSSHKEGGTKPGSSRGGDRADNHYGLKSGQNGKTHNDPLPTSDISQPKFDLDDEPSSWCEFKNDEKTGHRTAKPVALMEFLLKYWTKPDATVLDPTMGSGSMGIACKKMGRKFIGIELDNDIYKLACDRISGN